MAKTRASRKADPPKKPKKTTAIHIPHETWTLLREVAFKRAQEKGTKLSVSGVIVDLVESRRKHLEQEVDGSTGITRKRARKLTPSTDDPSGD